MSWLSAALSKSKVGRTLNAVAKPIQHVVNPIVDNIPVVGSVKKGVEAVGDLIPGGAKAAVPSVLNAATAPRTGADPVAAIMGFLTGNNGLNALGVAQGVNAAALGKQSTDYAKSALASANAAYDAKAPLRATGISNMTQVLGRPAPSTSPLAQIAARNPFAARS